MNEVSHQYQPADHGQWQGRADCPQQSRIWQQVQCVDLSKQTLPEGSDTCIIGFACDEGVKRNGGRIGAMKGPDAIRRSLSSAVRHNRARKLYDLGTIHCHQHELEVAQTELADLVSLCHQQGHASLVLGGGHEVAYGHFKGLQPHYSDLGIVNFDAHFDLRQCATANSGTPFWQIAQDCHQLNQSFSYCCIGVQSQANNPALFETAQGLNVHWLSAAQIHSESQAWQKAFLDEFILQNKHIYLSICMDVFAEAFAPGVSAPQALGLSPWQVIRLLKYVLQSGKVIAVDVAELSPPLDQDEKTARLAATLLAQLLEIY